LCVCSPCEQSCGERREKQTMSTTGGGELCGMAYSLYAMPSPPSSRSACSSTTDAGAWCQRPHGYQPPTAAYPQCGVLLDTAWRPPHRRGHAIARCDRPYAADFARVRRLDHSPTQNQPLPSTSNDRLRQPHSCKLHHDFYSVPVKGSAVL